MPMISRTLSWSLAGVGCLLFMAGCGGGGGGSSAPQPQPQPQISAFLASPAIITAGDSSSLSATYANGTGTVDQGVGALASGAAVQVRPSQTTTYTLTVAASGSAPSTRSLQVQVVPPPAQPTLEAAPYITSGASGGTASVPAQPGSTYQWTVTGGTLTSGQGTSQITYTAGSPGSLGLDCVVVNAAGAASSAGHVDVAVVAPPVPPQVTAPSLGTCGLPIAASAVTQSNWTLRWSITPGTVVSGQGGADAQVRCDTVANALLSVSAVNEAGAVSEPATATIVFVAPPAITSLDPSAATITVGDPVTLTGVFAGVSGVIDPGGIQVASGASVTVTPASTTVYTLTAANSAGATTSLATTITVVAPPSISSFGVTTQHAALSQGTGLAASFTGGTAVIQPGGIPITSGMEVKTLPAGPTLYALTVTNAAGRTAKAFTASYPRTPLAAGGQQTFLLREDGSVWGWGYGGDLNKDSSIPFMVGRARGMVSLASMLRLGIGLRSDGSVWTFQAGESTYPSQVGSLSGILSIAAGDYHALALGPDGTVWAWGMNYAGQLGDGTFTDRSTPVQVQGLPPIAEIYAGPSASFALGTDGTLWGWGDNGQGQLGDGNAGTWQNRPILIQGIADVASVAAGNGHTLAQTADGALWGWGTFTAGNVYLGLKPARIAAFGGVAGLWAGTAHDLVLTSDGRLWAWGGNASGQQGNGNQTNVLSLAPVPGMERVLTAAAVANQSFAVLADGSLWSWGDNYYGQLADGSALQKNAPTGVPVSSDVASMSGSMGTAYMLAADGKAWGWGSNFVYKLELPVESGISSPSPLMVPTGTAEVAGGGAWSLARTTDGSLWCWGGTTLVDGSTLLQQPTQVQGLQGFTRIVSGDYTAFALDGDGKVWGWGVNNFGQLGDGTTSNRNSPVQVPGLAGITALSSNSFHTLAVQGGSGQVWSWGDNASYQLGDGGTTNQRLLPFMVPGIAGAVDVAAAEDFSLALLADGSVYGWGTAESDFQATTPILLREISGIVSIRAGSRHVLALKADGTVWSMGSNDLGQLGRANGAWVYGFGQVPGVTGATGIHCLANSSYAYGPGFLAAWGDDHDGQLGVGRTLFRTVPYRIPGLTLF